MLNLGTPSAEGKTKQVYNGIVIMKNKDDITAGDGARRDFIPNKAAMSNRTTCNNFSYLERCGMGKELAFVRQFDTTSFLAQECFMYQFEVVVRAKRYGSDLKRHPKATKGASFRRPVVEFFLKTSGKKWRGVGGTVHTLPADDPLIIFDKARNEANLYRPDVPLAAQKPFLALPVEGHLIEHADAWLYVHRMRTIARTAFNHLNYAWYEVGGDLVDMKVEFGTPVRDLHKRKRRILLADVIDNDSWRVIFDGEHVDKQVYREGGELATVADKYAQVVKLTSQFLQLA